MFNKRKIQVFLLVALGLLICMGCKNKTESQGACPIKSKNVTISHIKENYKTLNIQNPALKGKILEFKDVTNYTYLNLEDTTGQIWAAVPKTFVKVGQEIEISNIMVMVDFHSKTLDKTFDIILFAVSSEEDNQNNRMPSGMPSGMVSANAKMPHSMTPESLHGKMPMGATNEVVIQNIKVVKADGENAYTIEEIYSKKKELANKTIKVRSKVVKFMPKIMGKNWIHIQDGSGSAENGDNSMIISSLTNVDIGDEIVMQGVLSIDKDVGTGRIFNVIVEDAVITKIDTKN